jgi:hypothetical protein
LQARAAAAMRTQETRGCARSGTHHPPWTWLGRQLGDWGGAEVNASGGGVGTEDRIVALGSSGQRMENNEPVKDLPMAWGVI